MNEILHSITDTLSYIFTVWCVVLYYCSIRKCFLREGKSKGKLLLLTLFVNPVTPYFVLLFGIGLAVRPIFAIFGMEYNSKAGFLLTLSIVSVFYVVLIFLFSRITGKWLHAHNRELVTFVSLMYGVAFSLSERGLLSSVDNTLAFNVMDLSAYIILFIASILLYRLVIGALSELTDRRRVITPSLFTVPPTVFILLYSVFALLAAAYLDWTGKLLVELFSTVIMFLFIWAFYVIIKNINATNEAVEAKELAAEMARTEALREADLNIARNIQSSALPSVFPAFPERKEFELYASMEAAKEVGGDFYDFYLIDENTLGFLIADVSGKSIPGAMFMMTSKAVVKSLAEGGMPPGEVFTRANDKLCEGNEAEMFVTAWLGYLDLRTGLVRAANAGHNPPVLVRGGKAEYVILKPGLMLAGMEGMRYREQEVQLEKGDILYLYTDGVTEAMDGSEELYGEERLQKLLSFGGDYPAPDGDCGVVKPACEAVMADIRAFVGGAEQSDDITMLCIRYIGSE
jgi:serine phosphatase RsbU (regulator of sigma subunit)